MKLFRNIYGLDIRSINLFRVALGVVMIGQIIGYVLLNFKTMFSPETGVLGSGFAQEHITTEKISSVSMIQRSFNIENLSLGVYYLELRTIDGVVFEPILKN